MLYLERTISPEERIRRAEEIYNNRRRVRNRGDIRVSSDTVNTNGKRDYDLFKKLILQILICLVIYFIFYIMRNSNAIFSKDIIDKAKEFLSYDINFQKMYEEGMAYYENNIKKWLESVTATEQQNQDKPSNENEVDNETNNETNNEIDNKQDTNEVQTSNVETNEVSNSGEGEENNEPTVEANAGIGGAEENEQPVTLSQMEIDANDIKANYSLIIPLKGTITSRFGPREATEIVSANHAGIDIAVNEGTVFTASMSGTVTEVTGEGGYGNHFYIKNGEVVTLYAHCKTIYVSEGQEIKQGEKIGEVGSTGKATRTTLTL